MHYSTIYVGMDVHKATFTLCCFTNEKEKAEYHQKVNAHYSKVINYIEAMRFHYGDDVLFICGYEAGCLGYSLYRDLTDHNIKCVILAPTTMAKTPNQNILKTDKRDAETIARCLAHHDYEPVHVPTRQDEQVKKYIRMRSDHKLALKKTKQQIMAFCLSYGLHYDGTKSNWTQAHITWLRTLKLDELDREILDEYLLTYEYLTEKIDRIDRRIEELSTDETYAERIKKLRCFIGIKTHSALSLIVETGDFNRFADAQHYAAYLGLNPGEHTSDAKRKGLGITKAGNRHLRTLLIEAAQCYARGHVGSKSRELLARQQGNAPGVIAYADKANERLRRKYYRMVLKCGKKANVAKTAVARELACFIWGMMTENIA